MALAGQGSVHVSNGDGGGRYVLTCDHASNFIPPEYDGLGLGEEDRSRHIAWDPGALEVARRMAAALDAPLVETRISRLVIDCNRSLDAPDLIPAVSESTVIPGNAELTEAEREVRIERCWRPFHEAVGAIIEERLARGQETRLVSVHSFNPVYKGASRPWQIGIIHDEDVRLAGPLLQGLKAVPGLNAGGNVPYTPGDRVYFTIEHHARSRDLPCAMIEIRNDELAEMSGCGRWAELLSALLGQIRIGQP